MIRPSTSSEQRAARACRRVNRLGARLSGLNPRPGSGRGGIGGGAKAYSAAEAEALRSPAMSFATASSTTVPLK
jgi:hypothetical protein